MNAMAISALMARGGANFNLAPLSRGRAGAAGSAPGVGAASGGGKAGKKKGAGKKGKRRE